MKKTVLAAMFALPMATGVALADEGTFHALSDGVNVAPMTDTQLDTVKGGFFDTCIVCDQDNASLVNQINASAASIGVLQNNAAAVVQTNNINI